MMVQFDVKRVQKGTESFMVSFDFTKTPVTQIADYIILAASHYGTSDIHFDPREDGMMVRFRIDGDCQDYTFVPKAYEKNLATRLKIMANMNITESRLPQDGAIKGTFGDTYLDMRVSALPLNEGEKIVIRILDYSRSLEGIDTLGFHPNNLEKIKRMMNLPNGIILTTGATGSGKSTTTYSILQGLNKPETNVITVEDPIEMNIEGINQVQVNAEIGMTFAAALRSILRQDPNVILIGEIRDSETAQIAVRASITGHLVLSTIHTNNALSTVERLLDMNVERYLLSTALAGIISQRLAKMLCPDCRYQRDTTKYEKKVFKKYMNMDIQRIWDANPKGCDHCRRGYHGRIAFHEVLEIDESVRAALSNEKLDKKDLAKMVYSGKTITMLQDALIKCIEGTTSFEEVYRNIEIENEDDDSYENEMATEIKDSIPVEEEVQVSDDLLETPVTKKEDSNIIVPPSFSAEDFQEGNVPTTASMDNAVQTEPAKLENALPTADTGSIIPTIPSVQNNTLDSNNTSIPQDANQVIIPTLGDNTQVSPVIPTLDGGTPTDNSLSPSVVPTIPTLDTNTIASLPTDQVAQQASSPALVIPTLDSSNSQSVTPVQVLPTDSSSQVVQPVQQSEAANTINTVVENPLGPVTPITLPSADVTAIPSNVQQLENSPFMGTDEVPPAAPTLPVAEVTGQSIDVGAAMNSQPQAPSQPLIPTII